MSREEWWCGDRPEAAGGDVRDLGRAADPGGQERGEFDNLPGAGKPIPGLDADDELWWVKQHLRRENLGYLPPTLALRKEVEQVLAAVPWAPF